MLTSVVTANPFPFTTESTMRLAREAEEFQALVNDIQAFERIGRRSNPTSCAPQPFTTTNDKSSTSLHRHANVFTTSNQSLRAPNIAVATPQSAQQHNTSGSNNNEAPIASNATDPPRVASLPVNATTGPSLSSSSSSAPSCHAVTQLVQDVIVAPPTLALTA